MLLHVKNGEQTSYARPIGRRSTIDPGCGCRTARTPLTLGPLSLDYSGASENTSPKNFCEPETLVPSLPFEPTYSWIDINIPRQRTADHLSPVSTSLQHLTVLHVFGSNSFVCLEPSRRARRGCGHQPARYESIVSRCHPILGAETPANPGLTFILCCSQEH